MNDDRQTAETKHKKRPWVLLTALSLYGMLYLCFIVVSFIPAPEGSPVGGAVPFDPFDLEQSCVKALFVLFLFGYFAAWKNELVAGLIFSLWWGAMWCMELMIMPADRRGGGIAMGVPLFILALFFLIRWIGRSKVKAPIYFLCCLIIGVAAALARIVYSRFPGNVAEVIVFSSLAAYVSYHRPKRWWLWVLVVIVPVMVEMARILSRLSIEDWKQGIGTAHALSAVLIPVMAALAGAFTVWIRARRITRSVS